MKNGNRAFEDFCAASLAPIHLLFNTQDYYIPEWCPVNHANKSVCVETYWNIDNNKKMLNWFIENTGKRMQGDQLKASHHHSPFWFATGWGNAQFCCQNVLWLRKPVLSSRVSGRTKHTKQALINACQMYLEDWEWQCRPNNKPFGINDKNRTNHVEYKKKPQVIGKEAKQYIEHDLK